MDIPHTTHDSTPASGPRPLGYWLRTVDALLTREFATAFDGEGVSRRDWMLLSVLDGDIDRPGLAERLARKGKKLSGLEDRGWVTQSADGSWTLTDEGRAAKQRLGDIVDGLRSRVAAAVSPDDYATTMASLEAIATELGWSEELRMPRHGRGRFGRRGFGPGFRGGFAGGFGPGFGPRIDSEPGERGHRSHGCGGHPRGGHRRGHDHGEHGERAFERGFDAGYARGREATNV